MKRRLAIAATAIFLVALFAEVAYGVVQFVYPFGAPIGDQGTYAVLGGTTCNFSSDADHTCSQAEYAGGSINATSSGSLTATRKMILPLNAGEAKDVFNATTGGQSITVGGATGTPTSAIPNGTQARVVTPDGVNYYAISGGSGGGFDAAAYTAAPGFLYYDAGSVVWRNLSATDLPLDVTFSSIDAGAGGFTRVNGTQAADMGLTGTSFLHGDVEACLLQGTKYQRCWGALNVTDFTDGGWGTVLAWTPIANEVDHVYMTFESQDYSADAGGDAGALPNYQKFNLEMHAITSSGDGAAGTTLLSSQAGASQSATTVSLAPLSITGCTGCTTPGATTGCACNGTTQFVAQATMSGSQVQIQVKDVGNTAWPWKNSGGWAWEKRTN